MRSSRRARSVALPIALAALGALLCGCTSDPVGAQPLPSRTPSAAASSAMPVPAASTPPPTQQAADATPVSVRCAKLVPAAVAKALEPDLVRDPDFVPAAGTPAAQEADLGGTACGWRNAAGDVLEVSVAKPSRHDALALKNDMVRRSNSVPTYGGEAYFQIVDHVGRVDAFRGRMWISARSNRFYEPGDAIDVIAAVDDALGLRRTATPAPADSAAPQPAETVAPATPAPTPTP